MSESPFFEFNFETTTSSLVGSINLGGSTGVMGQQFFTGTPGDRLRLRPDVDQQGASIELDRLEPGTIQIALVPEPEPLAGAVAMATLALTWIGTARRRNH